MLLPLLPCLLMQQNHKVCSNESHLFTLSIPLLILSLQLRRGPWITGKNSILLSVQGRTRQETCGIALTSAVSSCSWEVLDAFSIPSTYPKEKINFKAFPCSLEVICTPDYSAMAGWCGSCRWPLPPYPQLGKTPTILGSSFPGVIGRFHQLDPGAATHFMSLHRTQWFLTVQVQEFTVCTVFEQKQKGQYRRLSTSFCLGQIRTVLL